MASTRPYDNRLRQQQAQATADRIVEALIDLLVQERPASVSIPAVASRAGVSVRTVYHHFPSKTDLFEALGPYVQRAYSGEGPAGYDPDASVAEMARVSVPLLATLLPLFTALARAGIDDDDHARRRSVDRQRSMLGHLAHDLPDLAPEQAEHLANLLGAVISWPVVERLQRAGEDLGDASDLIAWMAEALVEQARRTGTVGSDAPRAEAEPPGARGLDQAGSMG